MQRSDQRKQLARVLARLSEISPSQGISHAIIHTLVFLGLAGAAAIFWQHDIGLAIIATIPIGIVYTAILVTTHDCIHHTYTGVKQFDDYWPVMWSWLIYWPHRTYGEIHKIHHAKLGRDLEDPERPTYLKSEFDRAGLLKRWYIRHQWILNIFILGGVGFIVKHWFIARRLRDKYPQLNIAMRRDMAGLAATAFLQWSVYFYYDVVPEYLVSFVIIERISGGLLQLRAMAEHYGLWEGRHSDLTYRQAMSCRNIKAGWLGRWIFNDLCFHSIHHVYPSIPWYKLGEAHLTIPPYWDNVNPKVIEPKSSYGKVFADGVRSWRLLDDAP